MPPPPNSFSRVEVEVVQQEHNSTTSYLQQLQQESVSSCACDLLSPSFFFFFSSYARSTSRAGLTRRLEGQLREESTKDRAGLGAGRAWLGVAADESAQTISPPFCFFSRPIISWDTGMQRPIRGPVRKRKVGRRGRRMATLSRRQAIDRSPDCSGPRQGECRPGEMQTSFPHLLALGIAGQPDRRFKSGAHSCSGHSGQANHNTHFRFACTVRSCV